MKGRERGPNCWRLKCFLFTKTKTNKQTNKHPVGEKQTGWLDKTQTTSNIRYEPTRNCKHKEILKGANDEGNGKQLGKINQ